ncbi:MAG TPA: aldehyde dehydrogenase family protein [Acidimicrobiales bacterium]|nr:aldehyde dehydrogenase family protein [Acidimicrobiales bacterium]
MNFIAGRWVASRSGRTMQDLNPADSDDVLGEVARSNSADVDDAVKAAKAAYADWAATPMPGRGDFLRRVGALLENEKDSLSQLMTREMGKTLKEARGDVQEGIDFAYFMAGQSRAPVGDTIPSELPRKFSLTMRHPIGIVGLITPWNFPIAIPTWKLWPALLAGNCVVLKAAEDTPFCAQRLIELVTEAGVPAGVVNLVQGTGEEAGAALVAHPDVRAISFTGSLETGKLIAAECGRQMKRYSMELGSKNVTIVMPDADLDLAVEGIAWGAFATSGQRCTATSRVVSLHPEFAAALVAKAKSYKVGPGSDETVDLAPLINRTQRDRVLEYIRVGKHDDGATLLTGGQVLEEGELAKGNYIAPTVFTDATPSMRIAQEEIFGPVTTVLPVADLDAAIAAANSTQYGLSASIYTNDMTAAMRAVTELEFGIVYVNAPTIGAEVQMPFGGMKSTGNGFREAGPHAMDEFSEWKAVSIDFSHRLQKAQFQPGE